LKIYVVAAAVLLCLLATVLLDRLLWRSYLQSWRYRVDLARLVSDQLAHLNPDWTVVIPRSEVVGHLKVFLPGLQFKNQGRDVFTVDVRGELEILPHLFVGQSLLRIAGKLQDGGEFAVRHRMNLWQLARTLNQSVLPVPKDLRVKLVNVTQMTLWGLWPGLGRNPRLRLAQIRLSALAKYSESESKLILEIKSPFSNWQLGRTPPVSFNESRQSIWLDCGAEACSLLKPVVIKRDFGSLRLLGSIFWNQKKSPDDFSLKGSISGQEDAWDFFGKALGCRFTGRPKRFLLTGSVDVPSCVTN
jgi:hypothetical protein